MRFAVIALLPLVILLIAPAAGELRYASQDISPS
jgi:hypothetical protein